MKSFFSYIALSGLLYFNININAGYYSNIYDTKPVYIVASNDRDRSTLHATFDKFGIRYKDVESVQSDDNLYIVADMNLISELPQYYIVYQTYKLDDAHLTDEYLEKLSNAVAIWDCSWQNIEKYKDKILHYYYFTEEYEYADPVILSCFLPVGKVLEVYKEVLIKSNQINHDISSHLPTLFVHTYLHNPELIFELGVASGQSAYAFYKASVLCNTQMVGLDINRRFGVSYTEYNDERLTFFAMNDLEFPKYYKSLKKFNNKKPDLIFIDTSHEYNHTLAEIPLFLPMLNNKGIFVFHDTNMSPLAEYKWLCINGVLCGKGWDNKKGVTRAVKESFSISFDESKYANFEFTKYGVTWKLIHYPFCNGLTLLKKLS